MPPQRSPYFSWDLFDSLIDQLDAAASAAGGRNNIDKWIISNTSDPMNPHLPWSFKEHEYQIGILTSQHPRNLIMKTSQIGVSEAIVRLVLALLAKLPGRHCIYTLPDATFARGFSSSRFDPVVAASKRLQALVSKDLNNSHMKQIGSSYLHVAGSQKESQSISVPASILIHDEFAYSSPEVLGTFNSRLGHLKPGEEIVYAFSTCRFPNADIHAAFLTGTQDVYMCYHQSCNHWVPLDPINDLKIPGYQGQIELFTKEDLKSIDPSTAYIECPHCRRPISQENLCDPTHRAWVSTYPDREYRSFDANFLVAPAIRPPSKVLKGRNNYRSTAKWLNFDIGRPADSSDSRITDTAIQNAFKLPPEDNLLSYLPVVGMDVGKTGHLIAAKRVGDSLYITRAERHLQDSENNLSRVFVEAYQNIKARQGVIDAGPEFTVVTKSQEQLPFNQIWGCYFVRGSDRQDLTFFKLKEEEGLVNVQRTKAFNEFVEQFNQGKILFRRDCQDKELISKHLSNLVRVSDLNPLGEEIVTWKSIGEDHYLFATFYAWLASEIVGGGNKTYLAPAGLPAGLVSKTRMKA